MLRRCTGVVACDCGLHVQQHTWPARSPAPGLRLVVPASCCPRHGAALTCPLLHPLQVLHCDVRPGHLHAQPAARIPQVPRCAMLRPPSRGRCTRQPAAFMPRVPWPCLSRPRALAWWSLLQGACTQLPTCCAARKSTPSSKAPRCRPKRTRSSGHLCGACQSSSSGALSLLLRHAAPAGSLLPACAGRRQSGSCLSHLPLLPLATAGVV